MNAADILAAGAETYNQRHVLYGDNYKDFGAIMVVMFPNGLMIKTVDEWNRLLAFAHAQEKLTRYAQQFTQGGHPDSAHDSMVYSAMLEEQTLNKDTR